MSDRMDRTDGMPARRQPGGAPRVGKQNMDGTTAKHGAGPSTVKPATTPTRPVKR